MVRWWWLGAAVLVVCALAWRAGAGDVAPPAPTASAMRAHVDPATGRLVPEPVVPPPPQALPAPLPPAAPVAAPGGGVMVELGGRFMSDVVATVGPDGHVRLDCVTENAPTLVERAR